MKKMIRLSLLSLFFVLVAGVFSLNNVQASNSEPGGDCGCSCSWMQQAGQCNKFALGPSCLGVRCFSGATYCQPCLIITPGGN